MVLSLVFFSLALILFSAWIILGCLIHIPICSFERGDVEREQAKLSMLKYNLKRLRDSLVDKYPIEIIGSHFFKSDKMSIDQKTQNSVKKEESIFFT